MADQSLIRFSSGKTASDDSPVLADEKSVPRWIRDSGGLTRASRLWVTVSPAVMFLLPSFVTAYFRRGKPSSRPRQIRPTAYLDGLRGVAAFFVFCSHWSGGWTLQPQWGYGSVPYDYNPSNGPPPILNNLFIQLPFIRVVITGRACVTVFFVISGYVLSIKPLATIYKGQYEKAYEGLAGAVFRRFIRLWLPILIVTFGIAVLRQMPLPWRDTSTGLSTVVYIPGFFNQIHHWFWDMMNFINPWRTDCGLSRDWQCSAPSYDGVLWTIPPEIKYSMVVFLFLLAFAKARRWVHVSIVGGFMLWQLQRGQPDLSLFLCGMLLAELSLNVPSQTPARLLRRFCREHGVSHRDAHVIHHTVSFTLFMFALFLFSFPERGIFTTFGYHWLARHVPWWYANSEEHIQLYWHAVASGMLILVLMYSPPLRVPDDDSAPLLPQVPPPAPSIIDDNGVVKEHPIIDNATAAEGGAAVPAIDINNNNSHHYNDEPFLQRLFTNRLAQYLGYLSFMLYLCHGAINATIGTHFSEQGFQLWMTFYDVDQTLIAPEHKALFLSEWRSVYYSLLLRGFFWTALVVIWVADILARAVDDPCVAFTRRLGKWIEVGAAGGTKHSGVGGGPGDGPRIL